MGTKERPQKPGKLNEGVTKGQVKPSGGIRTAPPPPPRPTKKN